MSTVTNILTVANHGAVGRKAQARLGSARASIGAATSSTTRVTLPGRSVVALQAKVETKAVTEMSLDTLGDLAELEKVPAQTSDSRARSDYAAACEAAINDQINTEYNISFIYHSMFAYFARDNIALPGLANYFKEASVEERGHAEEFMNYQNTRGGKVELRSMLMPDMDIFDEEKGDALSAIEVTLSLEKLNYKKLLALHQVAEEAGDTQMCDFVESHFLEEQVDAIKDVSDMVTELRRVGQGVGGGRSGGATADGYGVWQWDRVLLEKAQAA